MEFLLAVNGVVTLTAAQRSDERPPGRKFHTMTTLCGTTVLMFGGKGRDDKPLNDSWIFERYTETWTRPTVVSDVPVPALFLQIFGIYSGQGRCSCGENPKT